MSEQRILALDLSLSATGFVVYDVQSESALDRGEIKTPSRKAGQSDMLWNASRYRCFGGALLGLLNRWKPGIIVTEVSLKVFGNRLRGGRYGAGAQYRAGQGLGRAMGWIDGVMSEASAYGCCPQDVVYMDVGEVKLSVAGNRTADKDAVRGSLEEQLACSLEGWKPGAVDALAVLVAYIKDRVLIPEDQIAV